MFTHEVKFAISVPQCVTKSGLILKKHFDRIVPKMLQHEIYASTLQNPAEIMITLPS